MGMYRDDYEPDPNEPNPDSDLEKQLEREKQAKKRATSMSKQTHAELTKYEDAEGREVVLTREDIINTISSNPKITDKEIKLFIELARAQKLNPFTREIFITKYGDYPATFIVGKDVFTKRAQSNPLFKGMQAGIIVQRANSVDQREGSAMFSDEMLLGGWCKVYVQGYDVPIYDSVSFNEYAARKADGSLNSMWASKPATMIRKVAIVHALREAFPSDFQGLYDQSEMGLAAQQGGE